MGHDNNLFEILLNGKIPKNTSPDQVKTLEQEYLCYMKNLIKIIKLELEDIGSYMFQINPYDIICMESDDIILIAHSVMCRGDKICYDIFCKNPLSGCDNIDSMTMRVLDGSDSYLYLDRKMERFADKSWDQLKIEWMPENGGRVYDDLMKFIEDE